MASNMNTLNTTTLRSCALIFICSTLLACGGGGGDSSTAAPITLPPTPTPVPPPAPQPQPVTLTDFEAARFLSQTTFGPSSSSIASVVDTGLEAWFIEQLQMPPSLHLNDVLSLFPEDGKFYDDRGQLLERLTYAASDSFWQKAIAADDQLRQRMAYALSQTLVISSRSDLEKVPQTVAAFMDILTAGAFGNFRDLIEDVTYSPAMAIFLTYIRNQKGDPATGRVPDENYARELMQLFTIGLIQLNQDGTPVLDANGDPVELFDNSDITNVAKVFTGLSWAGAGFTTPLAQLPYDAFYQPLEMFDFYHSSEPKTFLGTTIPGNTAGKQTIQLALDAIVAHPNTGVFLARQLIQRFVTSDPSPQYLVRVSAAFDAGAYDLPSGLTVGDGTRGDLSAMLAAILFDSEARAAESVNNVTFGKLREPVVRFTHWARAFEVNNPDASNERLLRDTGSPSSLGQQPYGASSVFNFYRPAYIAPGTETAAAGLTAPELQIANATSILGYINLLTVYVAGQSAKIDKALAPAFVADYKTETAMASDPEALLDHLDLLLTHGTLLTETRDRINTALELIDADSETGRLNRARLAILMVMTSPEYIVLR